MDNVVIQADIQQTLVVRGSKVQNKSIDKQFKHVMLYYPDYAFIFLMVTSGLRTITTTRINISDIALMHNTHIIHVQRKGRSDKNDFIILEAEPYKAIFEYIELRFETNDFLQLTKEQQNEPLFVGHSNRNNGQPKMP